MLKLKNFVTTNQPKSHNTTTFIDLDKLWESPRNDEEKTINCPPPRRPSPHEPAYNPPPCQKHFLLIENHGISHLSEAQFLRHTVHCELVETRPIVALYDISRPKKVKKGETHTQKLQSRQQCSELQKMMRNPPKKWENVFLLQTRDVFASKCTTTSSLWRCLKIIFFDPFALKKVINILQEIWVTGSSTSTAATFQTQKGYFWVHWYLRRFLGHFLKWGAKLRISWIFGFRSFDVQTLFKAKFRAWAWCQYIL